MPLLSDIILYNLTRTMSVLDQLYHMEPDIYEDFIREICAEFTLAREYMLAIQEMAAQDVDDNSLSQADLTLKHLLALWILHNDVHIPLSQSDSLQ